MRPVHIIIIKEFRFGIGPNKHTLTLCICSSWCSGTSTGDARHKISLIAAYITVLIQILTVEVQTTRDHAVMTADRCATARRLCVGGCTQTLTHKHYTCTHTRTHTHTHTHTHRNKNNYTLKKSKVPGSSPGWCGIFVSLFMQFTSPANPLKLK